MDNFCIKLNLVIQENIGFNQWPCENPLSVIIKNKVITNTGAKDFCGNVNL